MNELSTRDTIAVCTLLDPSFAIEVTGVGKNRRVYARMTVKGEVAEFDVLCSEDHVEHARRDVALMCLGKLWSAL